MSTSLPSLPVAGVIPFSATDWPGHLTVTVFTQGCPLACPYCHNPQLRPVTGGQRWDMSELEGRRGLIDAVVFSGGEPTMHPGLGPAIAAVHARGFRVGLHTSGYRPAAIERLLAHSDSTPDWVGLDVKALPADCELKFGMSARAARGCWNSLTLLTESEVAVQVRTTVWPEFSDHLPELSARVTACGHELVVQPARGVDSLGRYCSGASPTTLR